MASTSSPAPFPGRRRKIAPFEIPEHPGASAARAALDRYAMEKAASLNQHVIGYGALAEGEWAARGLDAPDMAVARRYRLTRIRAELREARPCRHRRLRPAQRPLRDRLHRHAALVHAQRRALRLRRDRRAGDPLGLSQLRAPLLASRSASTRSATAPPGTITKRASTDRSARGAGRPRSPIF